MSNPRAKQRADQREVDPDVAGFVIHRDEGDKFHIPPELIPDGMTYEWKTFTVLGAVDSRGLLNAQRNRWTFVPKSRHLHDLAMDEYLAEGINKEKFGNCIIIDGLVLMERPMKISQIVRADNARRAREQVGMQFERLKLVPEGTMSGKQPGARDITLSRERDLSIPQDAGQD